MVDDGRGALKREEGLEGKDYADMPWATMVMLAFGGGGSSEVMRLSRSAESREMRRPRSTPCTHGHGVSSGQKNFAPVKRPMTFISISFQHLSFSSMTRLKLTHQMLPPAAIHVICTGIEHLASVRVAL